MKREEYIFNGILDAILYWFIYIVIPIIQVLAGFIGKNQYVHIIAVISMVGLIYDCYTRFDDEMERTARRKLAVIGAVSVLLLTISITSVVLMANGVTMPRFLSLSYAIIVLPIAVCIHDGWYIAKETLFF